MDTFTPLKTVQGLSAIELKEIIKERNIYIWGSGHLGRIIEKSFVKNGLSVKSFCDSNSQLIGSYVENIEVVSPEYAIDLAQQKRAVIIIASIQYKEQIEESCIKAGLEKRIDFFNYIQLRRQEAIVDIAGNCNIKCSSCPRGNMDDLGTEGYMNKVNFQKVLNKLISELPYLVNIELQNWGEPLMNPELPEIIQLCESSVPCTIATNLLISDNLENIIKAEPSQMLISVSGFEKSYEENQKNASWKTFYNNLHYLSELISLYKPKTQVTVLYHLYKNNNTNDRNNIHQLCKSLNLKFVTDWAYLSPYDKYLNLCEGEMLDDKSRNVIANLPWDIRKCLELAKYEANKPCLCQRIFPIINWDLSVSLCNLYYYPRIVENYLETPLDEIMNIRHSCSQCVKCQRHGLHRLDIEMLIKNYPNHKVILDNIKRV